MSADAVAQAVGMMRVRVLLRALAVLVTVVAVVQWLSDAVAFVAAPTYQVDFAIFYAAALALHADPRANIYHLPVLVAAAAHHGAYRPEFPYLYTPLLAVLMQPLTWVPPATALVIWTVLNLLLWLISTLLLARWLTWAIGRSSIQTLRRDGGAGWRRPLRPLLRWWSGLSDTTIMAMAVAVFVSLTYEPLKHGVILGQVTGFVLCLILLVPLLMRRRLYMLVGGVLALATLIKILPVILIIYFAVRGQWRVVVGVVAGIVVLTLGMMALGVPNVLSVQSILDNATAQQQLYNNAALSQVPLWVAAEFGGQPDAVTYGLGRALIALVVVIFAGGILSASWRAWRVRWAGRTSAGQVAADGAVGMLGYAWAIAIMLVASPVTWQHHDAWLLPPFVFCLGYALRELAAGLRTAQGGLKSEVAVVGALLIGYALTRNALPFDYDSVPQFTVAPLLLGLRLRPLFMLLRPCSAVLIWGAAGFLFLRATMLPSVRPGAPAWRPRLAMVTRPSKRD